MGPTPVAVHPDPADPGEPFSVVIPPPNVTGSLHMGHGFETALIDTIVRFQRLQGNNVLCLPGTDHASIAVQSILEKQIKAGGGSKDDLGRDAFLERALSWKAESGGTIVGQLRRLGYAVDWRRVALVRHNKARPGGMTKAKKPESAAAEPRRIPTAMGWSSS